MIKEAIDRILSLSVIQQFAFGGLEYTDRPLHLVKPPALDVLAMDTLTGFVDAIAAKITRVVPDACVIHVEDFNAVSYCLRETDKFGHRAKLLHASCEDHTNQFPYGRWMDAESFVIAAQCGFLPKRGDVDYVLAVASNLTAEQVAISEDDGISQRATMRAGVVMKSHEKIRPRVKLAPYRTFREVPQVESEFILRLKTVEGQPPAVALFEADGGKWKLDTILAVHDWLLEKKELKNIPIIA